MEKASEILLRHGVDLEKLVEAGFALYTGNLPSDEIDRMKLKLRQLLQKNLDDPNVALMIAAASHLDGLLHGGEDRRTDLSGDPAYLVADELIGMSIAEYIAGKRGLFNYVRYDREKPGIIGDLPPFMDDAVGALVAASMTRTFE